MAKSINIPTNLDEAVEALKEKIGEEGVKDVKEGKYSLENMHFTLGMKLRNDWGLWSGSELQKFFKDMNIHHADDMSGIILEKTQADITGEEFDLDAKIKHLREY